MAKREGELSAILCVVVVAPFERRSASNCKAIFVDQKAKKRERKKYSTYVLESKTKEKDAETERAENPLLLPRDAHAQVCESSVLVTK